jgi:hypothetical protein
MRNLLYLFNILFVTLANNILLASPCAISASQLVILLAGAAHDPARRRLHDPARRACMILLTGALHDPARRRPAQSCSPMPYTVCACWRAFLPSVAPEHLGAPAPRRPPASAPHRWVARHGGRAAEPWGRAPHPHRHPPVPLLVACRAAASTAASSFACHGCSSSETAAANLAWHGCSSAKTAVANLAHHGHYAETAAADLARRAHRSTIVISPSLPPPILLQRNMLQ